MTGAAVQAVQYLNRSYIRDFPLDAAKQVEAMPPGEVAEILAEQPIPSIAPLFGWLAPDVAAKLLSYLPKPTATGLLESMSPNATLVLLGQYSEEERQSYLEMLDASLRKELQDLLTYPDDSAGRLMETRVGVFRPGMKVSQALERLRRSKLRGLHTLFLVDDDNRLSARVAIHDLAVADLDQTLREIAEPVTVVVQVTAPRHEVVEVLEKTRLPNIPVIDVSGGLVGVVRYSSLVKALEEAASGAVQTMVGASRDERALSKVSFAVRKRQPWLQINLLTAFLAAAVVGLFEDTIAQVTALAILLPVVAGQSGNAGAQALAVTMRGLALREISAHHWFKVMTKEVSTGFINGVSIAMTCGLGVFIWSGSFGLVAVIAVSMILAMVAAGFAGAVIPIMLKRLGQDPAQSSSIILTTVTDVAGFFSFLGIATLLMGIL
ncbi:magnesium transporter [Algihabitans albus]|uniref:magnesium transporter n=1 Tax=Algihabitans albus TaxID=2164067 RepID=UPI000E5CAA6D|nr:magnesium transporter [Algihabitans albus]